MLMSTFAGDSAMLVFCPYSNSLQILVGRGADLGGQEGTVPLKIWGGWDGGGYIPLNYFANCYIFSTQCFDTVGWVIWPVKIRPRYDL